MCVCVRKKDETVRTAEDWVRGGGLEKWYLKYFDISLVFTVGVTV